MNTAALIKKTDDYGLSVTDPSLTDEEESDELFSDDEQKKDIRCRLDTSQDISDLYRSETPLLSIDNSNAVTPTDSIIPSAPLSLVPFLNKINEQWTSDLETPQANKSAQLDMRSISTTKSVEKTPKFEHTPDSSFLKSTDKITSDSPVIVSRQVRRRPKCRRIFKSIDTLAMTSNENINAEVDMSLVPENINQIAQDDSRSVVCIPVCASDINASEDLGCQILKGIQDTNVVPNTLFSSTQIFTNISFKNIDKLCSNSLDDQGTIKTSVQCSNKHIENINEKKENVSSIFNLDNIKENENLGFFTANGTAINVSREALLKATKLLTDEIQKQNCKMFDKENSVEQNNMCLTTSSITNNCSTNMINISVNDQFDTKTSNIGFQTARSTMINISEQALSRANLMFAKELSESLESNIKQEINISDKKDEKQDMKFSNIGFQTSRDVFIDISKQELPKAEIFMKELDKSLESNIAEKSNIQEIERWDTKFSNIAFQTARGAFINTSEHALCKANGLFAKELNEPLELNVAEIVDVHNIENKRQDVKDIDIGFKNTRDAFINISEQAFSKENSKISCSGFQTANGRHIIISDNALLKAQALFSDDYSDKSSPEIVHASLQKRKLSPDEGTPVGKIFASELKKVRLSEEFQTRKLFTDNSNADTDDENIKPQNTNVTNKMLIDDDMDYKYNKNMEASHIAELLNEIATNDPEYIPNEKKEVNFVVGSTLGSPKRNISKSVDLDAGSSPVLGRQPILRKRRSLEHQRDKHDMLQSYKILNTEFQTARDASINISREALFKARVLLAEELNRSVEQNTAEEINVCNKEIKKQEVIIPNIGFQTASGALINISEQALSKAKIFLTKELDKSLEPNNIEETIVCDQRNEKKDVKLPNVGFHTACGASINISKEALCKAKMLLSDEVNKPLELNMAEKFDIHKEDEKQKAKVLNVGFQTARGATINISEQALSKANVLFAKHLDKPLEAIPKDTNVCNQKNERENVRIPNIRFQTARGISVNISEQALSKAKMLLSDELNKPLELNTAEKIDIHDKENEVQNAKFLNVGFQTAHGASINISEQALSKANMLFAEHLDKSLEPNIEEVKVHNQIKREEIKDPNTLTTCTPIKTSEEILYKEKILDNADIATLHENPTQQDTFCMKVDKNRLNVNSQGFTQTEKQKIENNNAESTEYGDTQIMMDFINESTHVLQDRLTAALEQEEVITMKKRHKSKQIMGHLYHYKQINSKARLTLRNISNGVPPTPRSYQELIDQRIPPNILAITANTAVSYRFRCSDFYGDDVARSNVQGIEMEDSAHLIMDENGYVGVWEFLRAFLASPSIDPNLVPARWIENHYRWIVWKLASMDRMKFGTAKLPRALTPSHIMAQLKYRYDREIDRSQRPAIRHILEKDDVASKRMILCVSSIAENNNVAVEAKKSPIGVPKWKIELTDGWYSIPACVDIGMVKHISNGKVREGTKLLVFGAELLNCDEGCYPLEAPADVCLKLHTNSTRRARWDSKLGYTSCSGPIPIKLHNVCPNGGLIGKMIIIVARVYPILYHERLASGESIVRNAKCEEKMQMEYEQQCRSKAEAFYAKAEKDFQEDFACETDGMHSANPLSVDCERSSAKHHELQQELHLKEERFRQELRSKLCKSLPQPRQVSTLLKVRVCDGDANAILSIWSPTEEVIDVFKEGACISLCNITAAGKKGCELQLTARRSAVFNRRTISDTSYSARVCTSICEVNNSDFAPLYGEFDTVGFVCSVGPAPYGMKDFEVVHLAYPKADSTTSLYLSILFWQGIASYGYTEILTVGSVVACNNLEWRRATSWNVPVAYCTDRSTFTRNPRRNHLYELFESLRDSIADPVTYAENCISELNELQKKPTTRTPTRYVGKNTPNKIYNSTSSSEKKSTDYTSPLSTPNLRTANNSNYTATNSSIRKRLEKLQYYNEPPELSPIIMRSSKRISLDFRSPVYISNTNTTKDTISTDKSSFSNQSISPEKQ